MAHSDEAKARAVELSRAGHSARAIAKMLVKAGLAKDEGVYRSVARWVGDGAKGSPSELRARLPPAKSSAVTSARDAGRTGTDGATHDTRAVWDAVAAAAAPDDGEAPGDALPGAEVPTITDLTGDPTDAATEADRALSRLGASHRLLGERLDKELASPDPDLALVAKLTPICVMVTERLERLRPPPKIDPEFDPANLEARDALRSRILALVAEAEQRVTP